MDDAAVCLQVAIIGPVRGIFDYSAPAGSPLAALTGCRVRAPFGRRERVGVVVGVAPSQVPAHRLKPITALLDPLPLLSPSLLALARWAADYYCHPLGDALGAAFPLELRRGEPPRDPSQLCWVLTAAGGARLAEGARLGVRQLALLRLAQAAPILESALAALAFDARRGLQQLVARGWCEQARLAGMETDDATPREAFMALNPAQNTAVESILAELQRYSTWLLQGVTGSGKTEVYLHLARAASALGRQTLVLIPEIGLSEQLVQRFYRRFGGAAAVLHSELSDRERALVWARCRRGSVRVLLGTRSAVWAQLPDLGLIIVDEEHDPSFKQQEGFRYNARDVAVVRARNADIPVVLGSATPSLESELNAARGRYRRVSLPQRAAGAACPILLGLDVRGLVLLGGLGATLCRAMDECLARGEQVLLFLNRRGYAPLLMCHACGWIARCSRCDARLVVHREAERLICHHCDADQALARVRDACCADQALITLGLGTEQVEDALRQRFPGRRILRVDRDSMRKKGQLEAAYGAVRAREVDILLGTQMLSKGHDFPEVTLVGVVDADSRLFATDFRAAERFAQTIVQVAGRAGRGSKPGTVLVQTHHPDNPLLQSALKHHYDSFVSAALAERAEARLPPYAALAVVRAESANQQFPTEFLTGLKRLLHARIPAEVTLAGPVPAPMERKAGRYRAALLLSAERRAALALGLRELLPAIEQLPQRTRVRWHIDVDPQEAS
ncbi:MAG: primosomal protein N' [Gammaproteobacteria bacterium]|nr:primosomal protein N' [Gammaproteobacteria bacterium]